MKLRFSFNKDPSEAHLVSKGPFVCFRLKDLDWRVYSQVLNRFGRTPFFQEHTTWWNLIFQL